MIFPDYKLFPDSPKVTLNVVLMGCIFLFTNFCLFSMFLFRLFLLPKFDKKFKSLQSYFLYKKPVDRCYFYVSYISSIGLKRKKDPLRKIFGDYDFKSQTTRFERIISNSTVISFYIVILSIFLLGIRYLIYCIEYWTH